MRRKNTKIVIRSQVHITVDTDLLKKCYEMGLSPSEVWEFGMQFKLAEIDEAEFPSNVLSERMINLQKLMKERQ